ncbi:MAG: 4Fe-4S dicluster domain-containing protein [Clostridia bacterium]
MKKTITSYLGIKPSRAPKLTQEDRVLNLAEQDFYFVPLIFGDITSADCVVKIHDKVKKYQQVGRQSGKGGVSVFSPCSGEVVDIIEKAGREGIFNILVKIKNDKKNTPLLLSKMENTTRGTLLKRMIESGIMTTGDRKVGAFKNYLLKENETIDAIVVNACETDMFKSSETKTFQEYTRESIIGASLFAKACNTKRIIIVNNSSAKRLIAKIDDVLSKEIYNSVVIDHIVITDRQPLMDVVVAEILGTAQILATGSHVIMHSVTDCYNYYKAVAENVPVVSRIVTVVSDKGKRLNNYDILAGTTADAVAFMVEQNKKDVKMIITESMMSGVALENFEAPLALSSGLIVMKCDNENTSKEYPCINCSACVSACPMKLIPSWLDKYTIENDKVRARNSGISDCINCGNCSNVCPAKRHLCQRISRFKKAIASSGNDMEAVK